MNGIGWAVERMNRGVRVQRAGWNGKGMWIGLQSPNAHSRMDLPYVYLRTVTGDLVPWTCSQTDLLATDWDMAPAEAYDLPSHHDGLPPGAGGAAGP